MEKKKAKPAVDKEDLKKKAKENPKSKNYNNPNSRSNLKQYQKVLVPEIVLGESDAQDDEDVSAIVVGRKLNPELVKKLMPERGVLSLPEKKRFIGIVQQYLADFKNEEPTAVDIDDIFEIAKSDVMESRLYKAAKDSPDAIIQINGSLEKIYKRKQTAKENLAARRTDRKDLRGSDEITIVDLIVRYDMEQKKIDDDRISELLAEEEKASAELREVLEKDGY